MTLPFEPDSDPAINLPRIAQAIDARARACGRRPQDITLIAVTKRQPVRKIDALLRAGHRVFGENRCQEALGKWPDLRARTPDIELHMIGALQTNKVREAVGLFDVIHTVDRPKLARKLADEMAQAGRQLELFIQVNTGEEPQKSGILPGDVDDFVKECREVYHVPVTGLMCLPPVGEEPALHFALLRQMAHRNGLTRLSMGMSHDFEKAVTWGATHVRVGTLLMGPRAALPDSRSREAE